MKTAPLVCVLLLTLLLPGCSAKPATPEVSQGPIKIGVQGPITGPWAYEGQGFVQALSLLVDKINEDDSLGCEVILIPGDDKGDPKEAALVAERMVSQGVIAVVGSYGSACTEAVSGIYDEAGIVHISPSSASARLSDKGFSRFFRTCCPDESQGLFAARFIRESLGLETLAVVHDNTKYSRELAESTKTYFEKFGGKSVILDVIAPGEKEFKATIAEIKTLDPQIVYFSGYYPEAGVLVRQMKAAGIEAQFIAGNAVKNRDFVQIAGPSAVGTIITAEPQPRDLDYPAAVEFVTDYKRKYGENPPSLWTACAADAFGVIIEAIKQTQSVDPGVLSEYLHKSLTDYPGITGAITFDEKGDREGTIHSAYLVNEEGEFIPYGK